MSRNVIEKTKIKKRKNNKKISFLRAMKRMKKIIFKKKPKTLSAAIRIAAKAAKKIKINPNQRVIKIPKTGGLLPLIPIFAGLSALGAITGGVSSIAKAINDARHAKKELDESKRHNKNMEAIAIGGKGLYLKPYKSGLGLFLHSKKKQKF